MNNFLLQARLFLSWNWL